jgi:hypothetical protein
MKKLFTFFLVVPVAISLGEASVDSYSLKSTNCYSSPQVGTKGQFQSAHAVKFSDADAIAFSVCPAAAHDYLMIKFSTTKQMAGVSSCDDSGKSVTHQAIQNQLIST